VKWTLLVILPLVACTTVGQPKHRILEDALRYVESATTELDVMEGLGIPHGIGKFNPGDRNDPAPSNRLPLEVMQGLVESHPADLLQTLPRGTRVISYEFHDRGMTWGALAVYIGSDGQVLGYSYSKSLEGREFYARMRRKS